MSAPALVRRWALALVLGTIAIAAFGVAPAAAAIGIHDPDIYFAESDGSPAKQAGTHPFSMTTSFQLDTVIDGGFETPDEALRDLEVELPQGVVGIPTATARCSGADFANIDITVVPQLPNCSNDSVVGFVGVDTSFNPVPVGTLSSGGVPLYNLKPAPGTAAKFGFIAASVPITIEIKLSEEAPYKVVALFRNAPQPLLVYGSAVTLWGYPASPLHDPFRGSCLADVDSNGNPVSQGNCPVSPGAPEVPLLTLPRACQGPLTTFFAADSWEAPGIFATASAETHDDEVPANPIGFEGCENLEFDPTIGTAPTSLSAESPTGLGFSVDVDDPGLVSPTGEAQSDIKRIVAKLPKGMTINPSAGEGLSGCTTAQFESERLEWVPGQGCPQSSKVGTVSVESPLVDESLSGPLYVAQPDDPATSVPGSENPFDSFLAVYLVLRNSNLGVVVKQAGKVEADPVTGQLTTIFDDVPQVPFSHLEANFREGPRAPLVTPGQCGTYVAEAEQTPWARPGEPITTTASFEVSSGPGGGPCPGTQPPFSPGMSAGTSDNTAGAYSPFAMRLTRQDGEAEITRFSAVLPPGLTGKLAGIPKCSDAAIAAASAKTGLQELASPSCPAESQVGEVLAGGGVGPALTYVRGKIYLAGPYAGNPFSVAVVTPAVAGPFDVGNIVVREGLTVDPLTAEVQIDGSQAPIPRILKGIPLRLRDLRVSVDRQNFTLNPTSCEPLSARGTLVGNGPFLLPAPETIAQLATRFQAAGCGALRFKPKLSIALRGATKRAEHPALRAELKERPGDANLARLSTVLPPSQFIDPARVANPCTRPRFAAGTCPPGSVLGRVRAFTPLLDQPLEGPVYFRANGGERDLPDIVADLNGEVHFILIGYVDAVTRKGSEVSRIRTIFAHNPDVPVSKVVLSLKGGKQGLLQNSRNLCAAPQWVHLRMTGHNGKQNNLRQQIKTSCHRKR